MNSIICVLKAQKDFVFLGRASRASIEDSEATLAVTFSPDYRLYLEVFGAASYYGHELTGVSTIASLDVVAVTIKERGLNSKVPQDLYVVENTHIDGIIFWQDSFGKVYRSSPGMVPIPVYTSLVEFIQSV